MKKALALLVLLASQSLISDYENSLKGYWHGFGLIVQINECEDKICGLIEYMLSLIHISEPTRQDAI